MVKPQKVETTMPKMIKLNDFHSIKYLEKLRQTTYKNEKVVFILPNGRECK